MSEDNLKLYNQVRIVPETAKKPIQGGRLRGMTDINPMWRIKVLTEQFGPCGIGWYYNITNKWLEGGSDGEKVAFVDIDLYIKHGQEWSKPIQGTGGSSFISKESKGLYTNDECFKMALTDALGVAMKSLGVGADVYFEKDRSKYDAPVGEPSGQQPKMDKDIVDASLCTEAQVNLINRIIKNKNFTEQSLISFIDKAYQKKDIKALTKQEASEVINHLNEVGK